MKSRISLWLAFAFAFTLPQQARAAIFTLSNLFNANSSDTLVVDMAGTPLASGIVSMGYFPAGFSVTSSTSIPSLLSNFTILASDEVGYSESLSGFYPGYYEHVDVQGPVILSSDPLYGRTLYTFIGNGATLGSSNQFALFSLGAIGPDDVVPQQYTANPAWMSGAPVLGQTGGTVIANFPGLTGGPTSFPTLQLVPETSSALFGLASGIFFLRRRRS